jgi:hypothetical protein
MKARCKGWKKSAAFILGAEKFFNKVRRFIKSDVSETHSVSIIRGGI